MAFQFYCPQGHLLEGQESLMGQQSQCPMCGAIFLVPVVQAGPAPGGWPPGQGYGQPQAYGQPQGYGQSQGYGPPPGFNPPQGYAPQSYGPPAFGHPGYGQTPAGMMPPGYGWQSGPGAPPGSEQPQWAPGPTQATAAPQTGSDSQFPGFSPGQLHGGMPGAFGPAAPGPSVPTGMGPVVEQAPQIQPGPVDVPQATSEATPPQEPAKPAEPEKKEPRIVRIPCPQGHELQTPMDMVNQDVLCPICNTQFHLRYEDSIEFKQEQVELRRRKDEQLNQAALKWAIIAAVIVFLGILAMVVYLIWRAPAEPAYQPNNSPPAASEPASDQSPSPNNDSDAVQPAESDSREK